MLELINNKTWIYFVKNPSSEVHIRELARKLKISPPSVLKQSRGLLKLGLLKSKKQGKNVVLSANYDVGDFITMKKWTNIFLLIDSNLVKDTQDKVSTLILFGSFSRGEDIEKSDIDLAVDKELDINLDKYEGILNRNIQFHVINKSMGSNLKENIGQGILLSGVEL